MSWENILSKSNIRKADFDITWKDIDVDDLEVKNVPKELENMDEGFNTVDVMAGKATIEGGLNLDIRHWGVKGIGSTASKIEFVLTFEDTETDLYEYMDVIITDTTDETVISGQPALNPAYITVVIDMKGQKDPSQFETTAEVWWQGEY